jgi:dienelactone hydrolase
VALHPSNLVLPKDVEEICIPTSIGWGLQDTMTKIELKGQIEDIQRKEKDKGKNTIEAVHHVYSPGRHGFSIRGNPDDPEEKKILEDSLTQVLDFFKRHL